MYNILTKLYINNCSIPAFLKQLLLIPLFLTLHSILHFISYCYIPAFLKQLILILVFLTLHSILHFISYCSTFINLASQLFFTDTETDISHLSHRITDSFPRISKWKLIIFKPVLLAQRDRRLVLWFFSIFV